MTKTILIIDDDDMLRSSLVKGLRTQGFNTLDAASATQGAEILSRMRVDAIVLDRMMTDMDGLTFLRKLRKSGDITPVLMLTAMSGPENTIDGLSGGANDYLAKPFQLKELILRLENITRVTSHESRVTDLPNGLIFTDNEFFINGKLLGLSGEEKRLLTMLTRPVGNTAAAAPMVAKRLRTKLNGVLSSVDVITVRGKGYKLVNSQ